MRATAVAFKDQRRVSNLRGRCRQALARSSFEKGAAEGQLACLADAVLSDNAGKCIQRGCGMTDDLCAVFSKTRLDGC